MLGFVTANENRCGIETGPGLGYEADLSVRSGFPDGRKFCCRLPLEWFLALRV
jgi:hypothetical protein